MADRFLGRRLLAAVRVARWEREITDAVVGLLDEQLSAARAELAATGTVLTAAPDGADPLLLWDAALDERVTPVLSGVAADIYKSVNGPLISDDPTFLTAPGVLTRIDIEHRLDRVLHEMKGLGPASSQALGRTLTVGTNLGESVPQMMDRVQAVFESSKVRAERIVRTEVVGAANGVAHDTAAMLHYNGQSLVKVWLATSDERTRDTHAEADGQIVPYDQPFEVGDCTLDFPGDPNCPCEEEVINCRCTVTYEPDEDSPLQEDDASEDGVAPGDDQGTEDVLPAEEWDHPETDFHKLLSDEPFDVSPEGDGEPTELMSRLLDDFQKWTGKLNANERRHLGDYTNDTYGDLNRALRKNPNELSNTAKAIQSALTKAGPMDEPLLTYRGFTVTTNMIPGETTPGEVMRWVEAMFPKGEVVKVDGFMSTSPFGRFPSGIASGTERGVLMEIEARTGAFIADVSAFPEEGEFLMKHGSKFQVVDVLRSATNNIVIRLREIP